MAPNADQKPVIYAIVSFDREDGGSAHLSTFADPAISLATYEERCEDIYDTPTEDFVAIYADGTKKTIARADEFPGECRGRPGQGVPRPLIVGQLDTTTKVRTFATFTQERAAEREGWRLRWHGGSMDGTPRATRARGAAPKEGTMTYSVGYFIGSLSSTSINRILSKALVRLAPRDMEFTELPIGNLPLYSPDFDSDYPPEAIALKEAIAASDAVLFVTPEYNRSIPGALKNAIDWASRPWGQNSFDHMPAAVIGASPGQIGTAVGQQSLRAVLSFCNARQMTAPEAYITFRPGLFTPDGEVTDQSTASFLSDFMNEFRAHIERVLTVLPRS